MRPTGSNIVSAQILKEVETFFKTNLIMEIPIQVHKYAWPPPLTSVLIHNFLINEFLFSITRVLTPSEVTISLAGKFMIFISSEVVTSWKVVM